MEKKLLKRRVVNFYLLVLLILSCSICGKAQSIDTIKIYNQNDITEIKDGYHIFFRKEVVWSGVQFFTPNGCINEEYTSNTIVKEGKYKNGKKAGIWKYYDGNIHITSVEYTVNYLDSMSQEVENYFMNYKMIISANSSLVKGSISTKAGEIYFQCDSICRFNSAKNREVISFRFTNFEKLDFELLRFHMDVYYRETLVSLR